MEILVADVASANNGGGIVGNEQFVVHPVIHPLAGNNKLGVAQQLEHAARVERIEEPDFDSRMSGQCPDLPVASDVVGVIDQHSYAYPAIGSTNNGCHQQLARRVVLNGEILQVECTFRCCGKFEPHLQPFDARRKEPKAR